MRISCLETILVGIHTHRQLAIAHIFTAYFYSYLNIQWEMEMPKCQVTCVPSCFFLCFFIFALSFHRFLLHSFLSFLFEMFGIFGVCMLCALIRWNFAFLNERHEWSNMKWYNVYHQIFKNECLRIHCNCIEEIKSLKWGSTCSLVATVPHTLIYYFQFYITY